MWTVPPMPKMIVEILCSQLSTECRLSQYESRRSNVGLWRHEVVECSDFELLCSRDVEDIMTVLVW